MFPLADFTRFIQENSLFEPSDKLLLAVSGGRDSVLMAHLFKQAGFNFGIAHVNFQLRGAESDAEEAFVKALAADFSVPFFSTHFNTPNFAQSQHLSIQMAARELRYDWLETIRQENNYQYIALAHHQNDSIETVLLNLVRGTGVSGLHGILPKRGKLIRPLLFLKREEIDGICEKTGISYRDDSSNESVKYARNKIRLEVIPKLKELNPALEETFEANRKRMEELEMVLHLRVAELKTQLFKADNQHQIQIDLAAIKQLQPLNTLLFELFRPYGFSATVLSDLIKSWDGQPGKVFESATHQLLLDRQKLLLSPISNTDSLAVALAEGQETVVWSGQNFKAQYIALADFELAQDAAKAQLDYDLLTFPLVLRAWKMGDVFKPLGMKGQKKLSDFFIEQKIPLNQKKQIAVLQNGNGDVLWLAGLRIDERYKVSTNSKKVFILELNS